MDSEAYELKTIERNRTTQGSSFFPQKRLDVVDYYTHLAEDEEEFVTEGENGQAYPLRTSSSYDDREGRRSGANRCWSLIEKVRAFTPSMWVYLALLGGMCAIVGAGIDNAVKGLVSGKSVLSTTGDENSPLVQTGNWFVFVGISCFFAVISASVGDLISRHAEGSGIPEMKAYLGGATISHYLDFKVFLAKTFGLIFSLSSGVSIGKEGPFVHIASTLADTMFRLPWFANMGRNPALRRQMLAAAVAAGVTMSFGTPVGGVLFSIEVTATYFLVSNLWKGFYCVTWTMFFIGTFGILGTVELFDTTQFDPYMFGWEIAAYTFLGILCGLIGATFNYVSWKWMQIRDMPVPPPTENIRRAPLSYRIQVVMSSVMKMRYMYTLMVTIVASGIAFFVHFMHQSDRVTINEMFRKESLDHYVYEHWLWPSTLFNFFLFIVLKLLLTSFSITLPIPNGVLTPIFAIGAVFGRFYGQVLLDIFKSDTIFPGTYAVVGAAALTSAVTRTLSIVIIVFEITGQLSHMLPVLIAVLVSYSVSGGLSMSIYDVILNVKNLPYLPFMHRDAYSRKVNAIMNPDVGYITKSVSYLDIMQLLASRKSYVEFPLVESDQNRDLIGSIPRGKLTALVYQREDAFSNRISADEKKLLNAMLDDRDKVYGARGRVHWTTRATSFSVSAWNRLKETVSWRSPAETQGYVHMDNSSDVHDSTSGSGSGSASGSGSNQSSNHSSPEHESIPASDLTTNHDSHVREQHHHDTMVSVSYADTPTDRQRLLEAFDKWMDIPFDFSRLPALSIDEAPLQVQPNSALPRTNFLFAMLGLEQILVVDKGVVVGIITKDDMYAAKDSSLI